MDGIAETISQLERHRKAIDEALVALREVEPGQTTAGRPKKQPGVAAQQSTNGTAKQGRKPFSAATRRKMAAAQKRRWAAVRKQRGA